MRWKGEFLRHVKKLHVYLDEPLDTLPESIVERLDESFVFSLDDVSLSWIDGLQVFSIKNVSTRLYLPEISWSDTLTASELAGAKSISCFKCSQVLMDKKMNYKDLPSTYWMELVDCWSCHKSEFAGVATSASFKTSASSNVLLPSQGAVHAGLDCLYFHQDDFNQVNCPKCNHLLGEPFDNLHFKLYKPCVSIVCSDNTMLAPKSALYLLFCRLHELMQSHAVQAFAIVHQKTIVYLTILNWDLMSITQEGLAPAIKLIKHVESLLTAEPVPVDVHTMAELKLALNSAWPRIGSGLDRMFLLDLE